MRVCARGTLVFLVDYFFISIVQEGKNFYAKRHDFSPLAGAISKHGSGVQVTFVLSKEMAFLLLGD